MADFNKLKDTIRGAIYPNGRGAISADKHQAALLDMADTMQETAAQVTELSDEIAGASGRCTLDFDATWSGVDPYPTSVDIPSSNFAYVCVHDKNGSIKYFYIYGYKQDGSADLLIDSGITNYYYQFDSSAYKKIGVYVEPSAIASSSVATLEVLVNDAAKIESIEKTGNISEQIDATPTISIDGYYVSTDLKTFAWDAYAIYSPIFLKKGDKMYFSGFANDAIALLSECNEGGTLLNLIKVGIPSKPYFYEYIAEKDMYVCICSAKSHSVTATIYRRLHESINLVESRLSQKVSEIENQSTLQSRSIKNLCDLSKAKQGFIITWNGQEEASNSHYASDFIPVVNGEYYSMPVDTAYFGEVSAARVAYYNGNKEFIAQAVGTLNGSICTIQITDNSAAYIRTSIRKVYNYQYRWAQNFDTYMVVNSDTYPNRYIPFGDTSYYADYELAPNTNALVNPLFGKSVVFDGDSICNADSDGSSLGWAGRIGRRNKMLWQNWAIGGGTITDISGKHCISSQSYENANPDYIIIEGGTNDADIIGSILNNNKPALFGSYDLDKYDGDYNNTTYCGAIEFLFKRLLTTYPSAKIGVIIAPKMGVLPSYTKEGNNRRAYFETLMILCEKWGIPYINLWDKGRLNPSLSVFYNNGENSYYTDGQHLTAKGYEVITPMIEAWMKTL